MHAASRAGLEERVRYLLEFEKTEVNSVDEFDSTPLYYAVYGGHESVVRLLLANGARCDPETFVGERCYYGALNDSIRALLKRHNATDFSVAAKHPFARFVRGLARAARFHDIAFVLGPRRWSGCRVVLGARCRLLRRSFLGAWAGRSEVALSTSRASPSATAAVLSYVATGRFAVEQPGDVDDCLRVARDLKLERLARAIDSNGDSTRCLTYEDDVSTLRESMEPLAALVSSPHRGDDDDDDASSDLARFADTCCDVRLDCCDGTLRVPSALLRFHSDVLDAGLGSNFAEALGRFALKDVSVRAATAIVRWCCCGTCSADLRHDASLASEVLAAAHRLLMPADLISTAAGAMSDALRAAFPRDANAAMAALPYAELDHSERLYAAVCDVCAHDLLTAVRLDAFKRAVVDSAASIQDRQATDSVPFIDDIRKSISAIFNPMLLDEHTPEGDAEAARLKVIDDLLDSLGIDG